MRYISSRFTYLLAYLMSFRRIGVYIGLSDSAPDDSHVTSKSVPSYCDVIEDNMAASECSSCQLYHQCHHRHHHQRWTIAPPPPSYSSTNWDATPRPLQPSAPHPDSAHFITDSALMTGCDDDTVTSRTRYVTDSPAPTTTTISNQDTILRASGGDSLLPAVTSCPQCRRQRPACV